MGLIGARGSPTDHGQIESEGEKDGHQTWSSDGGHADQIEFQALPALQSLFGLEVNILATKPPPQQYLDWIPGPSSQYNVGFLL